MRQFDPGGKVTYTSLLAVPEFIPVRPLSRSPDAATTPTNAGQVDMRWSNLSSRHKLGFVSWVVSYLLLVLPTAILGFLAHRTNSVSVAGGAAVQGMFLLVFIRAHPVWRPPIGVSVVILYLIGLIWAWMPLRDSTDWAIHVAQGVFLLGAVALFAINDLVRSGAEPLRQANKWSRRIAVRRQWPLQLSDCRMIPEVASLRDAIRDEPGPALSLLSDPRPEVQAAALGALEYRPVWRPGEAELVLQVTRDSPEPAVRVAAAYALAGVHTPELIDGLAGFLRDSAAEARRAAAEALMWNADNRWPFARNAVKEALADPRLADDGPMFAGAGRLPAPAVADLITWSSEHPPLAGRAIYTLIDHYHADLLAAERPELPAELAAMMLNNDTPPALRVEIAALLRDHHLLSPDLLDRLTNLDQPAPIRLFAAELMLRINPHDPDGVDVLRGLARQPNRELAVRVAAVLQNILGLELGLPPGDLPAPNSKPAADVAKRVLAWANGAPPEVLRPTPGPRPGLKSGSRPGMGGLRTTSFGVPTTPAPAPAPIDDSLLAPPSVAGENPVEDNPSILPPDGLPGGRKRPGSSHVF
jgi:HEAT repeats